MARFCDLGSRLRQTASDFEGMAALDAERAERSRDFAQRAQRRSALHASVCGDCCGGGGR